MNVENRALNKKRWILKEDIKKHMFYLNRWEYINKKKAELNKEKMAIIKKMSFASAWFKIRQMHLLYLPIMYEQFMIRKNQIAKEMRIDRCVRKVAKYFRRLSNKSGATPDIRKTRICSFTFAFV